MCIQHLQTVRTVCAIQYTYSVCIHGVHCVHSVRDVCAHSMYIYICGLCVTSMYYKVIYAMNSLADR